MDFKKRIIEILEQGHLISLGTLDDGGVWVADLIYIYDDKLNIYWMSDPEVRHSKAILKDEKVAGTITISNKSKEDNFGIQIEGVAKKIDGPRYDLAIKHLAKRGHPMPKEKDDVLDGDSWYVLTPIKIDLVDEKHLGFEKWTLDCANPNLHSEQ